MPLMLPARLWIESESNGDRRPGGYTVHRDEETAVKYAADYWTRERARNVGGKIPAIYTFPSEKSVMVEVSQDLHDEVMDNGTVWAHATSHQKEHARSWRRPYDT